MTLLLLVLPFFAGLALAQSPDPTGGPHKALANLWTSVITPERTGAVKFTQMSPDSNVTVMGSISGLDANALRGMHIYDFSNFSQGCDFDDLGAHFNPTNMLHGDRTDPIRHVGDLGNIQSDGNGNVTFDFTVDRISLFANSTNSILGRALVVHSGEDDLGRGGTPLSNTTGNSGFCFAYGIIIGGLPIF